MGLLLPNHMARNSTRILNVLVPMKHLPDRSRLGTDRIPHMRGKDQRVPARVVVKHDLGGSVRQNAPVPVELAIDTDRRKRRRQSARSKNMLYRNVRRPAVEIAHLAGAHMGGANRKPRSQTVDPPEIDEFQERFLERHGRIEPGVVRTDRKIHSPMRQKVWPKERRNTADQDRPIRESVGKARRDASKIPSGMRFNPLPELPELRNSVVAAIARDQTGIDCADRSPDNPVRLDIRFIQSLIDARLVRSKRATTLKHQHYLAG